MGHRQAQQCRKGRRFIDHAAPAQRNTIFDVRPLCHKDRLRAIIRHVAVGRTTKAVVAGIKVLHQRTHSTVTKGGIAVRFDHKGKSSVEVLLFPRFTGCINAADAKNALFLQRLQLVIDAGHQLFVEGILYIDRGRHCIGKAEGTPICNISLLVHIDQAGIRQLYVQVDGTVDIALAMVADHYQIGLIQYTDLLQHRADLSDIAVKIRTALIQI